MEIKKMKKIVYVAIAVICIGSSYGTVAYSNGEAPYLQTTATSASFPLLEIKQVSAEYLSVEMHDVSSYIMVPGKPVLPKVVKIFELPFCVKNVTVNVTMDSVIEHQITREIRPAPHLLPLTPTQQTTPLHVEKDLETYSSNNPYPSTWYSFSLRSGLNKDNQRVTFVIVHLYPIRYYPCSGKIVQAHHSEMSITYEFSKDIIKTSAEQHNLLIITPSLFKRQVEKLVNHKNDIGVKTFLKTTESIYKQYEGRDKPEQIKYFIKDAIETYDVTYVLLVGGLKNQFFARPKDDANQGSKDWYVPVRYTNLYDKPKFPLKSDDDIFDPGSISDLYYADIYDGEGNFSSWDPNNDGVFAAWGREGVKDDLDIDMVPDVYVGRLACRSIKEVKTVVNKIITYETTNVGQSDWFNRVTVFSGDGFLDQQDLNFQWDTTGLKNGPYTIYAQSFNKEGEKSTIDTIPILIDRSQKTSISFKHNDHVNPGISDGYPAPPVAEIVTISPGDVLGFNDLTYTPGENEAYCNNFNPWANISYESGVLTIRGKTYDPKPYGNLSDIHVWIKDNDGLVIFSEWRNDTEMYYEGEWVTGEKTLYGRGGALSYMPETFEREILWASNGRLTGLQDVLQEWKRGSGFVFLSGHGSPNTWGDHFPGVPGNRQHASFTGLSVIRIKRPLMPIDSLSNGEKLPITVIGGCHNSQFNVSMITSVLDILPYYFTFLPERHMWTYGVAVPECFSWRLVRSPRGGSIATIGNTGLGYGMPGKDLTTGGGDGWISIEFFRQYGSENETVLGAAHSQAITSYIQTHDMSDFEAGHAKTVQQWVLLGDPSLMIGGY